MKLVEFRIILPTTVPKYQIGNLYMCVQRTRETQGGGEGLEILVNEPYDENGERGQFTHKVMHFKSRVPATIRWAIPDKYLHCHERSHNGYPHYHTVYEVPGMGKDFSLLVESQHIEYDKYQGCPDNLLNLTAEELQIRKVVYLDIVSGKPKPDKKEWELQGFVCPEAEILTPLQGGKKGGDESKVPEWVANYDGGLMVAVKVVKFLFHWKGLQTAVEKYAVDTAFHDIFLESNRVVIAYAKDWFGLTIEDIRRLEAEVQAEQRNQRFDRDDDGSGEPAPPPAVGDSQ
jgi:hypothetical protein